MFRTNEARERSECNWLSVEQNILTRLSTPAMYAQSIFNNAERKSAWLKEGRKPGATVSFTG